MYFFRIKLFKILAKVQFMRNKLHQKTFNDVKNGPDYKPSKIGMSGGNPANFATLGGCNLAGNSFFRIFFADFFMLAQILLISKE